MRLQNFLRPWKYFTELTHILVFNNLIIVNVIYLQVQVPNTF